MSIALKLTQVGNSVGVILPKDLLARLKLEKGDTLFLTEAPDGYRISPYDADVAAQVETGRAFMKDYRQTFRTLAK